MRKELLGPLPIALGLVVTMAALVVPQSGPPPACDCPTFTPEQFEAQDEAGYPATPNGTTVSVYGQLSNVNPLPAIAADHRSFSFHGSTLVFNVTSFPASAPYAGGWVRIRALHNGEAEDTSPEGGHQWTYLGPASPPGALQYPPLALVVGIAMVAWGAATFGSYRRARSEATTLRARYAKLSAAAAKEPAVQGAPEVKGRLPAAARELRRGQYAAARESLDQFEMALKRAQELGKLIEGARAARTALVAKMKGGGLRASEFLDAAEALRGEGALPEAEKKLAAAMAEIQAGSHALDLIDRIAGIRSGDGDDSAAGTEEIDGLMSGVDAALNAGPWSKAEELAAAALVRTLELSPAAQSARAQIQAFEEAFHADRAASIGRDITNQLTAARSAYSIGDFVQASALARAGAWVVDENALGEPGLRRALAALWQSRGWSHDEKGPEAPAGGMVFVRAGERVVVVTTAWREFPPERVLLAVRDYLRAGGAARAVVFSSAFANTSTDPKVEVVTLRQMLEQLTEAAAMGAGPSAG